MMVLLSIEEMLADLGCKSVFAAATVERALELVESEVFDVALLDVNLSGTRSYPVADALSAHAVPFLFSTGYTHADTDNKYTDAPILNKPYHRGALCALLTQLLAA